MPKKKYNFNTPWDSDYWMESNGFFCGFNMPDALVSQEGEDGEVLQELPDYNWRSSFLVDEYPASPKDWMLSEGRMASHFVPIQDGKGMWLDFNKNNDKKHHVAIVVSIQGVNAITGLPCNDPQLEQYADECPKHKKAFGPNRLCEECGFKWPKQNYLCTTGTPTGSLWLDGFRAANGAVQQYLLTEKTMKGVASNILGKDRVYAIGISFFLSKNPKPVLEQPHRTRGPLIEKYHCVSNTPDLVMGSWDTGKAVDYGYRNICDDSVDISTTCDNLNETKGTTSNEAPKGGGTQSGLTPNNVYASQARAKKSSAGNVGQSKGASGIIYAKPQFFSPVNDPSQDIDQLLVANSMVEPVRRSQSYTEVRTKNMEIGAGASIRQQVEDDTEPLDYWREKPEALLCINYCLEDEAIKILQQGKVSKQGHPQGFLQEVPVGN